MLGPRHPAAGRASPRLSCLRPDGAVVRGAEDAPEAAADRASKMEVDDEEEEESDGPEEGAAAAAPAAAPAEAAAVNGGASDSESEDAPEDGGEYDMPWNK